MELRDLECFFKEWDGFEKAVNSIPMLMFLEENLFWLLHGLKALLYNYVILFNRFSVSFRFSHGDSDG